MNYIPPTAEVIESKKKGDVIVTVLRFDQVPPSPIAPGFLSTQDEKHQTALILHALVHRAGDRVSFETYDSAAVPLEPGHSYGYTSWWAPWQLDLVQNHSHPWALKQFQAQDAIAYTTEQGTLLGRSKSTDTTSDGSVVPGGWTHEHCSLCWQTISDQQVDQHTGYTDGKDWLCETCYDLYITSGFGQKLGDKV
jgi:hypothetical protein